MKPAARFLRWWLVGLAGSALLWFLLLTVVDPFGLHDIHLPWGLNASKLSVLSRPLTAKPMLVRRVQPDSVILGSSRAHGGFDADSDAVRQHLGRTFNLALDGPSAMDFEFLLQRSADGTRFRTVLMGVDHGLFQRDFHQVERNRLRHAEALMPAFARRTGTELLESVFSWTAARAALSTLRSPSTHPQTALGFKVVPNLPGNEHGLRLHIGWVDAYYVPVFATDPLTAGQREAVQSQWQALDRMIDLAAVKEWRLVLFVEPAHARFAELRIATGLRPAYEQWLTRMSGVVASARKRGVKIELRDCATYNEMTTEAIPEFSDRQSRMRYFVDSTHFTPALGDRLIEVIFQPSTRDTSPGDFGFALTPENIQAHLAALRIGREQYARSHPREIAEVRLIVNTQARHHGLVFPPSGP
jgi:hypothetical protein